MELIREDEATAGSLAVEAQAIYQSRLRSKLEPKHSGQAVAIHVDTADYALGRSHMDALRNLRARHPRDGRVVILTIGPPTDADRQLLARSSSGFKA